MPEIVRIEDSFYILATSSRTDTGRLVLKHGDTFALFDRMGDITLAGNDEDGLYHAGTRFLREFEIDIDGQHPMLLSSTVADDNILLAVDLTNPDIVSSSGIDVPRGTLHLLRSAFLYDATCYCRIVARNHGVSPVTATLGVRWAADFADVFEVRGLERAARGVIRPIEVANETVTIRYVGLDRVTRTLMIRLDPRPQVLDTDRAEFELELEPGESTTLLFEFCCRVGEVTPCKPYRVAFAQLEDEAAGLRSSTARVTSSNDRFNAWLDQSEADLHTMTTCLADGIYPYAGVPWFSTPFGRDGIITALQCLTLDPKLAHGVLAFLARTQATALDPARDAEPGKILHEMRDGEMAALGEVPFGRYYGSIDATPLFIGLAGAYLRRTGDVAFLRDLMPALDAALKWIDDYGDPNGDGFYEYLRHSSDGLVTQGWKDSFDSVFHADGRLAQPPVALCEVQGYVYQAWRAAAFVREVLGDRDAAEDLRARAAALRERFEARFWDEELGTYVLALDGEGRPCRVRTSNAGHALFTQIASPERAARTTQLLTSPVFYSGWGVRTVAEGESRYNPMAYHNGSVWPHDNALIADGMARYGAKQAACAVMTGLFEASHFFELSRMPELFCGFPRRPRHAPTRYPLACAPQAWAAGSVFMLLDAALGLRVDALAGELYLDRPMLPEWVRRVRIENLAVGEASIDIEFEGQGDDVIVRVPRRTGEVDVSIRK